MGNIDSSLSPKNSQFEPIRWAPKLKQHKLWQLYQSDAQGLTDENLIDEVGTILLARCQSIIMVTEAKQVFCPKCHQLVECLGTRWSRENPPKCINCSWQATYGQWRHSWRHQDLIGGNAMYAFRDYVAKYPKVKTRRRRMFLIDRLINAFHWSIRRQRHHGPAANQLIQGKPNEVLAFLDRLSGGDDK